MDRMERGEREGDRDAGEGSSAEPTLPAAEGGGVLVPGDSSAKITLPASGYQLGAAIGRGGMGEVVAAFDQRIGRDVAIKRMRGAHPSDEATFRFLREARIQARLDHPAVVPVYELGVDEAGRPYFTMKRLAGQTLQQRLADGAAQRELLRAFVDVCLAVDFAHARGVIHRDLKPSNIMLGDYGEVYVLDWGVARVLADAPGVGDADAAGELDATAPMELRSGSGSIQLGSIQLGSIQLGSTDGSEESTKTGTVLGTPGYIAPEQLKGDAAFTPADVYSLGSILFELLSGELLHPRSHQRAIASTLTAPQELPSRRAPDRAIPPELDALCFEALAEDPDARPTARALAQRVQAFLDGDRDVARRRELAIDELREARAALTTGDAEGRTSALRRAGRALALDPGSSDAAELIGSMLLAPPTAETSPALAASLDQHERELARGRSKQAIYAYLSVFALLPIVFLLEVRNWWIVIACYATICTGIAASWVYTRTGRPSVPITLAITLVLAVLFTRIASPFVLAPLLVCCALAAITSIPAIAERPWLVVSWTIAAVMLPFCLEWAGALPRSWQVTSTHIEIRGDLFRATGRDEEISLVLANLLFSVVVCWLALALSRQRLVAQRQLYVQAWHLGQLVPARDRPPP